MKPWEWFRMAYIIKSFTENKQSKYNNTYTRILWYNFEKIHLIINLISNTNVAEIKSFKLNTFKVNMRLHKAGVESLNLQI